MSTSVIDLKLSSEPVGDGGDQHPGLDRFGRVVNSATIAYWQYVLGTRYADDLVFRNRFVGTANRYYALADYFQTTSLVNPAGEIEQRFVYRAFGDVESYPAMEISSSSSSFLNNDFAWTYLYGGYQLDLETGLYQVRNRYYHTSLGRWLSRDPLKGAERKQGANLYWYVANNAVNTVDPTGLAMVPPPSFDLNLMLNDSAFTPQSCPTLQNPGPQLTPANPIPPIDTGSSMWGDSTLNYPGLPPADPSSGMQSESSISGDVDLGPASASLSLTSAGDLTLNLNLGGTGDSGASMSVTANETISTGSVPPGTQSVSNTVTAGDVFGATLTMTSYANGVQSVTLGGGLVGGVSMSSSASVYSITIQPPTQQQMQDWENAQSKYSMF